MKKCKKLLLAILILIGIICFKNFYGNSTSTLENNSDGYEVIKLDENENYKGIGQKSVEG